MWGFEIIVMVTMIGVNSVFAGYEIALASVTLARLQLLADDHRRGAAAALYMKQNMEASLAVVQLGITLVGAIAAAVGGAGAEESIAPVLIERLGIAGSTADFLAITLVVIPLTIVTIIVGELIPKVFALRNSEWVLLTLSPYMRWFSWSVWPAVWLFETIVMSVMSWGERQLGADFTSKPVTAELQDLRASAALARASRLIGHREEKIIVGATEMTSRTLRDIMLAAEHINTLDAQASLADNLIAAHFDMHTRFPVVERKGDPQSIIGYVNVKDIIAALRINPVEPSLRGILRTIPSFSEATPLTEALEKLMRARTHIALVSNANDAIIGMITIEDILEELVGEIEDEYDKLPNHVSASGSGWVVGGGVPLSRLESITGSAWVSGSLTEKSSLDDWVTERLRRGARGGDVIEHGHFRVFVRKTRRHKVLEAYVLASAAGRTTPVAPPGLPLA